MCDEVGSRSSLSSGLSQYGHLLKVAHFNAGGLCIRESNSKIDEIRNILGGNKLDLFGVSETWTQSYMTNRAMSIGGYKIIINDRHVGQRGG